MDLDRLRTATRPEHEATESIMPLMNPTLTPAEYIDTLQHLYQIVSAWEAWALANVPTDLLDTVRQRQRAPWLLADLKSAHTAPQLDAIPFAAATIPGLDPSSPGFRSSFLGAMYVMEGSTLGGQYIARHLESTLNLTPGNGDAYFHGYGENTGSMWRAFKLILAEIPDADADLTISSAVAMFRWFAREMVAQPAHK